MQNCIVATYESIDSAKRAVEILERSEYPANQISLVTHNVREEVPQQEVLQYGDETTNDAAKGAGAGGLLGLLLGTPLLFIPGVGPLLVAGPLAVGLTGAIVGGFLGAMGGWGIHKDHVEEYEQQVRGGDALVVANGDPVEVCKAFRLLKETDPKSLHHHEPTSADSPEVDDTA